MSADISSDTSRSTYWPTLDRYVDRHIGQHSADMLTDTSVDCRSICRSRGAQNTQDPKIQGYIGPGRGADIAYERVWMLVGNFELNP